MENEEILIEKAQRGDKEAFGVLYKHYFLRIYRYCKANIYRDDLASDICQETFLRAWKSFPTFSLKNGGTLQAYLFRIARNLLIDLSRKKKEFSLTLYKEIEIPDTIIDKIAEKEAIETVKKVLAKLPEKDRQIVYLRYFEELSYKDMAKILGIREGALRVRTTRVLQKLKELLNDYE